MRSDHLNKHMKTHNPQTTKKVKEEKVSKQQSNGQSSTEKKVKIEKSELSAAALMYNHHSNNAMVVDYQNAPNLQTNNNNPNDLFIPHPHSFPMLDNASYASLPNNPMGSMGFNVTMPY